MNLKDIGREFVDWIRLVQDKSHCGPLWTEVRHDFAFFKFLFDLLFLSGSFIFAISLRNKNFIDQVGD